ncbi:hypothetical protein F2Q70_00007882 [Brassica cretica]|uniref:2-methoxy-6-polyprenyl-1,4-benzoquinol methylase, mitochondrial n=1 Tax=Brassica cretica TaxID=69181 RepID=A0A8S9M2C1_BRACR|nr:hypothetical protein F2Q68_00000905 [Brassica cretica]KAF2611536.1 hypothetical protein F2Q70_00007882 [Brassica cretica]
MKHLDVAGGTGDVAFRIFDAVNSVKRRALRKVDEASLEETQIYVCDINPNMLNVGKQRAADRGLRDNKSLVWVEGDAEALSFDDNSMDGYTIAFGIRNVTHIEKALAEAYRVLKRGGRFLCLELSHVDIPVFKELYDLYSFQVIPNLGELIAGDRDSYQYLVESVRRFPPQERFAKMIGDAGFEKLRNLAGVRRRRWEFSHSFARAKAENGGTAKQHEGDLQRKLVQTALSADSSGGVQFSLSLVCPTSAVCQVIIGGAVGGGAASGGSGGGGEAAAATKEEEKKRKETLDLISLSTQNLPLHLKNLPSPEDDPQRKGSVLDIEIRITSLRQIRQCSLFLAALP